MDHIKNLQVCHSILGEIPLEKINKDIQAFKDRRNDHHEFGFTAETVQCLIEKIHNIDKQEHMKQEHMLYTISVLRNSMRNILNECCSEKPSIDNIADIANAGLYVTREFHTKGE
jgi:hypothetical protein